MDLWELVARVFAPIFLLATASLIAQVREAALEHSSLRGAVAVRDGLLRNYPSNLTVRPTELEKLLDTLRSDVARETVSPGKPMTHEAIRRLITKRAGKQWMRELTQRQRKLEEEIRETATRHSITQVATRQRRWRRHATWRFEWHLTNRIIWPAYKASIDSSAQLGLLFGSTGLLIAAIAWFICASLGMHQSFIAFIGNGSAFGAFLGFASSVTYISARTLWASRWPHETHIRATLRRTLIVLALVVAWAFVPLVSSNIPRAVSGWIQSFDRDGYTNQLLTVLAGLAALVIGLSRLKPLVDAPPWDNARRLAWGALWLPLSLAAFILAAQPIVSLWPTKIAILAIFSIAMVAVIISTDIWSTRTINERRVAGVARLPQSASVIEVISILIACAYTVIVALAVELFPQPTHTAVFTMWVLGLLAVWIIGRRRARSNASRRDTLLRQMRISQRTQRRTRRRRRS